MNNSKQNARQHTRFGAEKQVAFYFNYDFQTPMQFQDKAQPEQNPSVVHYSGVSKNVSAEGVCFTSNKELHQGDRLQLDMYLLDEKNPVHLEGEVRWSRVVSSEKEEEPCFETGVKLMTVEGKPVADSIYYDEAHHVIWSAALESILGNFRRLVQENKVPKAH